jgi:TRIAP1/MDM35 family protein
MRKTTKLPSWEYIFFAAACVITAMASSLSPKCTPFKHEYDTCFNAWFEGYLEPALPSSATTEERAAYSNRKADEFEQKCGKVWNSYRECVQVSVFTLFTTIMLGHI